MGRNLQNNHQQIAEQASEWFVRMRDNASLQTRKEFTGWLLDSPVHIHEYLVIAKLWGEFAHIDPSKEIDITLLLPIDTCSNVVTLEKCGNT